MSAEAQRKWAKTPNGRVCKMYSQMRTRTKHKPSYVGFEVMPREDFDAWMKYHWNEYMALFTAWEISGYSRDLIPTIDRLDSYKGYSHDNIRLATLADNMHASMRDRTLGRRVKATEPRPARTWEERKNPKYKRGSTPEAGPCPFEGCTNRKPTSGRKKDGTPRYRWACVKHSKLYPKYKLDENMRPITETEKVDASCAFGCEKKYCPGEIVDDVMKLADFGKKVDASLSGRGEDTEKGEDCAGHAGCIRMLPYSARDSIPLCRHPFCACVLLPGEDECPGCRPKEITTPLSDRGACTGKPCGHWNGNHPPTPSGIQEETVE